MNVAPIQAEHPCLTPREGCFNSAAVKLYPDGGPHPDRWTVVGPACPNEVWIHRALPCSGETGYRVSHRHSGGAFPRLFAPLAFEVLESPRYGYQATPAATFTEAYALAVRLVRAYGARS